MTQSTFRPFTMVHEAKGQFARFEPTDDPEVVFVRFQGACGRTMENVIDRKTMVEAVADLFAKGYKEIQDVNPPRFLHDLAVE